MKASSLLFRRSLAAVCLALSTFAPVPARAQTNTGTGAGALSGVTSGINDSAYGFHALNRDTTANSNTAVGASALAADTTGGSNTAVGLNALLDNDVGGSNIALGINAGSLLTTGDHNIDIGNQGVRDEANVMRLGTKGDQTATFVAGISGTAVTGSAVVVDANGQLGVAPSSARFKDDIHDMSDASGALYALRPVSFRYRKDLDPQAQAQFGLVAEEVEKVAPSLVAHDAEGKPFTVRYEQVNAMLLNEFLKAHAALQTQAASIARLEAAVARLEASQPPAGPAR